MKKNRKSRSIANFLSHTLWSYTDSQFVRRFKIVNALWYRWPIKLSFDSKSALYRIKDSKGHKIFIGRKSRLRPYKKGIPKRLKRIRREYLLDYIEFKENDICIDCGANVGEVTKYLQTNFGVRVISIEPDATEFRCLKANADEQRTWFISQPLWSGIEEMPFYAANETGDSSLFAPPGSLAESRKTTTTLDTLLDSLGLADERIRLLKLEAEGAEPEILQGARRSLAHIDYIAADVGPERGEHQKYTLVEVTLTLSEAGFELVSCGTHRLVVLFANRHRGSMESKKQ